MTFHNHSPVQDLTKRYNRLRQTVTVTNQKSGSRKTTTAPLVLPATNKRKTRAALISTTPAATVIRKDKVNDQLLSLASKFSNKLSLGDINTTQTRKGGFERINHTDRADRATNEQVLDPRTRLVLFKMLGRGLLDRIEGCISTGKEANVYHAITLIDPFSGQTLDNGMSLALKIYKTSILVFKDRDRYVTGEFRFRSGYARRNPRKMVRLWAEKELRNLKRLEDKKVRCPRAVEVRSNVLVMEFLALEDDGGWKASPRLKDAVLPVIGEGLDELYWELVAMVRIIYQQCKLVHADLSEYNILYHRGHLFIIDVSQSVEHDHPSALDFLRSDLTNIDNFFSRLGLRTLGLKRTFEFVTGDCNVQEAESDLVKILQLMLSVPFPPDNCASVEPGAIQSTVENTHISPSQNIDVESEEAVFRQAFIPRTLNEVYDAERDAQKVIKGEGKQLIYASLTGLVPTARPSFANQSSDEGDCLAQNEQSNESESDQSQASETGGDVFDKGPPRGFRFVSKEEKKTRKALVKEEQKEKRQRKIPKGVKKRQVAKTSGKR